MTRNTFRLQNSINERNESYNQWINLCWIEINGNTEIIDLTKQSGPMNSGLLDSDIIDIRDRLYRKQENKLDHSVCIIIYRIINEIWILIIQNRNQIEIYEISNQ